MVDPYNTTALSQTVGLYEWSTQVNILTEGWFAILLIFSFYLILNIVFRQYDTKAVALTSAFLTAVISLFLFMISWVSVTTFFVTVSVLAVSIIAQVWRTN